MTFQRLIEKTKQRLDREIGAIYKSHSDKLKFALAFPNRYYTGMSNLGLHIIYKLINVIDDCVCERVFLPDKQDIEELTKQNHPLFTMESQRPVREFDVVAFSVSYELDYPGILKILKFSKIPYKASDREGNYPLVIAGGPAATFNPEPLANFIDMFVIGEAEAVLPSLIEVIRKNLDDRRSLLEQAARLPGIYVPKFYTPKYNDDGTISEVVAANGAPERVKKRWIKNLEFYPSTNIILTPETEFSNMILAEVARGCGRRCKFCAAGYTYLPARSRSAEAVLKDIEVMEVKASQHSLHPRSGLLSASVFDHPSSLLICQALIERERLFSISSTRADTLNHDIVKMLRQGGHETLTIAPEAGTERLRNFINKGMSDNDILEAAKTAWEGGFRRLKLYFMIGLPSETAEDIDGIVNLVSRIRGMFDWEKLSVSISCFVPKPWTPFQWAAMQEEKALACKLADIRTRLRTDRVEITGESAREAVVQGVLARGDRKISEALIAYTDENISWRAAFRKTGIDPAFYAQRERSKDEIFPWDHLDLLVKKSFLWREYTKSAEKN